MSDSDKYPYGRSGEPIIHYSDETTKRQLRESAEVGDNEVKFSREQDVAVLYEAPADDDPGRGHLSVWKKDGMTFNQSTRRSGDDGDIFQQFNETDPDAVDA